MAPLLPLRLLRLLPVLVLILLPGDVDAQVVRDGSLGPGTDVQPVGPAYQISEGMGVRPDGGPNLFHSFDRFSLGGTPAGRESAHFEAGAGVENILARVTGGVRSDIDGRLGADANLFLMNPSGILFGPNATLDVNGSFHATTADQIHLSDGGHFEADPRRGSVLTVAPPSAFGFLAENPANVEVRGADLQVAPGETLDLVGGDVIVAGPAPTHLEFRLEFPDPGPLRALLEDSEAAALLKNRALLTAASAMESVAWPSLLTLFEALQGAAIGATDFNTGIAFLDLALRQGVLADPAFPANLGAGSATLRNLYGRLPPPMQQLVTSGGIRSQLLGPDSVSISAALQTIAAKNASLDNLLKAPDFFEIFASPRVLEVTVAVREDRFIAEAHELLRGAYGIRSADDVGRVRAVLDQPTSIDDVLARTDFTEFFLRDFLYRAAGTTQLGPVLPVGQASPKVGRPGADVRLVAAGGSGSVALRSDSPLVQSGGTVTLTGLAAVDLGGSESGSLWIRGANFVAEGAEVLVSSSFGNRGGVDVKVANDFSLRGFQTRGATTSIAMAGVGEIPIDATSPVGVGVLPAPQGKLPPPRPGSLIVSEAMGDGDGPAIEIDAGGNVDIDVGSAIQANAAADANGGSIRLGGAQIKVAGAVRTTAIGRARGGDINIEGQSLSIPITGAIGTTAAGSAAGGAVSVAADSMTIASATFPDPFSMAPVYRGLFSVTTGDGRGGNMMLETRTLSLSGVLPFLVTDQGAILSATTGSGRGGDVHVIARESLLQTALPSSRGLAASILTRTENAGCAGDILIEADRAILTGRTGISAENLFSGSTGRAGDITLRVGELQLVDGALVSSATASSGRSGDVHIEATRSVSASGRRQTPSGLTITRSTLQGIVTGSGADPPGSASGDAGDIFVSAPILELDRGTFLASTSLLSSGKAGDVTIDAGRLTVRGGAAVDSSNGTFGKAGSVTIRAAESVAVGGRGPNGLVSRVRAATGGVEDGGRVSISTPSLVLDDGFIATTSLGLAGGKAGDIEVGAGAVTLRNGSAIDSSSLGTGRAGTIRIQSPGAVLVTGPRTSVQSQAGGDGDGGSVEISAGTIDLRDGGTVSARAGFALPVARLAFKDYLDTVALLLGTNDVGVRDLGATVAGRGGDVVLRASRQIVVDGGVVATESISRGTGGHIVATAPSIDVRGGGLVSAASRGPADGGAILLAAGDRAAVSHASIQSNASQGKGGDVEVRGRTIEIGPSGEVAARSAGPGDAGSVRIRAADSISVLGGVISTDALQGSGGNIEIEATRFIELRNGQVTASVTSGAGGNISIDPQYVVVDQGSRIVATAVEGRGGNIRIRADVLIVSLDSIVSASSQLGVSGSVTVDASNLNALNALSELPASFIDAAGLLRQRCAQSDSRAVGSFVVSAAPSPRPGPDQALEAFDALTG